MTEQVWYNEEIDEIAISHREPNGCCKVVWDNGNEDYEWVFSFSQSTENSGRLWMFPWKDPVTYGFTLLGEL